MHAYVLIGLSDCDEQKVIEEFLSYPEVVEAHILFGEWDIIVNIKVSNSEEAGSFVMSKIRQHKDVKLTSTMIVAQ